MGTFQVGASRWISTSSLFYYFHFLPYRVGKVGTREPRTHVGGEVRARSRVRGHPTSLIGCLFTPDCPALVGQVLSRACWEGVRGGVVAEIPSPMSPRGRARTLALSAGSGGEPRALEGGPLATPTRPRPYLPAPPPVPRPGRRRHRPSLPACRAAAAARRAEPGGGEAFAV